MAARSALDVDDVVVSKFQDGHLLWTVTPNPSDRLSLMYRGNDWNVQYAVARGARLASGRGGNLWYTSDETATLEYLETFRRDPPSRGREGAEMTSYWLDTGAGEGASFGVFKDKAGADESVRLAADFVRTKMAKLLREKPEIIEGPIKAHD